MSNIRRLLSPAFLFALIFSSIASVFILPQPANAAPLPLDPGCYYRTGVGQYEERDCRNDEAFDAAVESRGACFVTRSSGSYVFFEIDCDGPGLDLAGDHNGPRAQRVCEALVAPHVWVEENNTCHYGGAQCREILVAGGVYSTGTCQEHASIETMFGRYLRDELPLTTTTPPNTPAPPATPAPTTTTVTPINPGAVGGQTVAAQPAEPDPCGPGVEETPSQDIDGSSGAVGGKCGELTGACDPDDPEDNCSCNPEDGAELNESNCRILEYLVNGINFLSALVGIVAVFSIIWAGYQYITARENPQAVSAAKNRITITMIGLLLYIFMYAILNYLVPGGLFPS